MEPSPEIRDIILGWFEAAQRGDAAWRDRHVSRRARIVGTDPNEWLEGDEAYEFLKNEAEGIGGKISVTVPEAEGFREGSVGWGLARPIISLPDGNQVSPRWSAVFHQEDGQWRLVQLHASIAISNEESFGEVFSG